MNPVSVDRMERAMDLFTPSRPDRGIAMLWLFVATAVGFVLYVFDPSVSGFFPGCPFRSLTGLLCPGCGTTRALHQLLHGEVLAAIRLSPMLVIVAPILGYAAVSTGALLVRGRPLRRPRISAIWIWMLLTILIGFWVLRNTPWWA